MHTELVQGVDPVNAPVVTGRCRYGLAVEVCDDAGEIVVSAYGELDGSTSPLWRTVLRGLIEGGHRDLTVDLEQVTFVGAAGVGVIAEIGSALRSSGGTFTVRAASASTRRLLELAHVDELISLTLDQRGALAPAGDIAGADAEGERVAELVRVGSMIAATATVDRALQLVTVLAKAAVDGADGVSVSLERDDRLSTVAWSNDTVLQMDLHQYRTGEGPCVDAARTGRWFHSDSLRGEQRWPEFVPRARQEGIASILSTPLVTSRSVGALNIYSNTEGVFSDAELSLAGMFAQQASGIVAASLADRETGARLAEALLDREVIAQAQGVVMAREHITARQAATLLFAVARDTERTLSQHAAAVVASTEREVPGMEESLL